MSEWFGFCTECGEDKPAVRRELTDEKFVYAPCSSCLRVAELVDAFIDRIAAQAVDR